MKKLSQKFLIMTVACLCFYSINEAQQQRSIIPEQIYPRLTSPAQTQTGPLDMGDRETFNVKKFGARGNGKTDDTQAIKTAVQAIASAGGGRLFFPNGAYPVSSPIDLPSGITLEGTNGSYNGNCQLLLTVANQKLLTIGENKRRISIRDIELKAAPASVNPYRIMNKTIAIDARGANPNSSYSIEFKNLTITGFDRGISVEDTKGEHGWQFDNVVVDHVLFAENNYGIYMNSQNASYWKVTNCWFVLMPGGYGIYLETSGFMMIDSSTAGGAPNTKEQRLPSSKTFIYVGGAHGSLTVINSQAEGLDYFMEVVSPPNYSYPITVINSIIGPPVMLRANCIYVSIGNYYAAGAVRAVDKGTDVLIHSMGDVAESPMNSGLSPRGTTPFQLQVNSRVIFGSGIHGVEFGKDATFNYHVGIGTKAPADAVLSIATPIDNEVQLRIGSTQGYYYDMFRDTTGYLTFRGNQSGYTGFRFNGDIVPAANRNGNLGTDTNRWGTVHAVKVVSGDAVLSDKETGEELYRIREDQQNIYFDDIRTGKQLMRLDREGNLHVAGKVFQNSK